MYKYIGTGLLGLFILMIFPSSLQDVQSEGFSHYGAATITLRDSSGSEVFQQTVHNRLVDDGENFMLQQTFKDTVTAIDDLQMAAICITNDVTGLDELQTAGDFDTENTLVAITTTGGECKEATTVLTDDGTTNQAVMGPITFTGGTEIDVSGGAASIVGLGICQGVAGDTNFENCATTGVILAQVATSTVVLAQSSTDAVDVTYTLDLTSIND